MLADRAKVMNTVVTANVFWVVFESIIDMNNIKEFMELRLAASFWPQRTGAGVGSQCGPLVLLGLHA